MASSIVTRGSRVYFTFVFLDENEDVATVTSAKLQLTFAGREAYETTELTLTETDGEWKAEWESTPARPGWVEYHAHALSGLDAEMTRDGRFRLRGNRANLDHDALPRGSSSSDYR
jgi:hypothetical protein